MANPKRRCLVIMPFSQTTPDHTEGYWTDHFENFLKPLIEACPNVEAHRSLSLRDNQLTQAIVDLNTSPVVVADVTDHDSSVYWALGVRQSFAHGTVVIAQHGTRLPFDLSPRGVLYYATDHLGLFKFGQAIKDAVSLCLDNPDNSDSHVLDTITGRGSLYESLVHEQTSRKLDGVLAEIERNDEVYRTALQMAKDNQEGAERVPSVRFRTSAIDWLLVARYLDQDDEFYGLARLYYDVVIKLNDQLTAWESDTGPISEWFVQQEELYQTVLKRVESAFTRARNSYKGIE